MHVVVPPDPHVTAPAAAREVLEAAVWELFPVGGPREAFEQLLPGAEAFERALADCTAGLWLVQRAGEGRRGRLPTRPAGARTPCRAYLGWAWTPEGFRAAVALDGRPGEAADRQIFHLRGVPHEASGPLRGALRELGLKGGWGAVRAGPQAYHAVLRRWFERRGQWWVEADSPIPPGRLERLLALPLHGELVVQGDSLSFTALPGQRLIYSQPPRRASLFEAAPPGFEEAYDRLVAGLLAGV